MLTLFLLVILTTETVGLDYVQIEILREDSIKVFDDYVVLKDEGNLVVWRKTGQHIRTLSVPAQFSEFTFHNGRILTSTIDKFFTLKFYIINPEVVSVESVTEGYFRTLTSSNGRLMASWDLSATWVPEHPGELPFAGNVVEIKGGSLRIIKNLSHLGQEAIISRKNFKSWRWAFKAGLGYIGVSSINPKTLTVHPLDNSPSWQVALPCDYVGPTDLSPVPYFVLGDPQKTDEKKKEYFCELNLVQEIHAFKDGRISVAYGNRRWVDGKCRRRTMVTILDKQFLNPINISRNAIYAGIRGHEIAWATEKNGQISISFDPIDSPSPR